MVRTYQPLSSKRRLRAAPYKKKAGSETGSKIERQTSRACSKSKISLSAVSMDICSATMPAGMVYPRCSTWTGNHKNTSNSTLAVIVSRGKLEDEDVVSITRVAAAAAAELLELVNFNFQKRGNEKCRFSCGKYWCRRLRAFQESRRDRLPVVSSG